MTSETTTAGFTIKPVAQYVEHTTEAFDGENLPSSILDNDGAEPAQPPSQSDDYERIEYSQDELAFAFTRQYGAEFRYVDAECRWYRFTGTHWQTESTGLVFDRIRKICGKYAAELAGLDQSERRGLVRASNVAGVERLTQSDRQHAATTEQWDNDQMLLNTPACIVDLRTGQIQEHNPQLYMKKITSVSPQNILTPLWDEFLARVQPDPEIRSYLRRRSGYALTGLTGEQALFFDHGTGANGKSVFQKVLLEILHTYAVTAPMELLIESRNERHPTEIARLQSARAVGLAETNQGRRWSEDRIKVMTGGERLAARYMRQNFFEFTPEFKLLIMGNHMPTLRNVDEAIRRRLQIVRWSVKIPSSERIDFDEYIDMLRPEFPGILHQWIQGCLEWQQKRLNPPASVIATTEEYLHSEDSIGRFIEDCTRKDASGFSTNEQLYNAWCQWCESQGEFGGKKPTFTKRLEERGLERGKQGNDKGFKGIVVTLAQKIAKE